MTPWTVAHQAPLSLGFSQARILEWVTVSFSMGSSQSRDEASISCTGSRVLCHWATWKIPLNFVGEGKMQLPEEWAQKKRGENRCKESRRQSVFLKQLESRQVDLCQICELTFMIGHVNACLHLWKFETWSFIRRRLIVEKVLLYSWLVPAKRARTKSGWQGLWC